MDPRKVKKIDQELKKIRKKKIEPLLSRKLAIFRKTGILCKGCQCKHSLSSYKFIQYREDMGRGGLKNVIRNSKIEDCAIRCSSEHISFISNHPERDKIIAIVRNKEGFPTKKLFEEVISEKE